MPTDVDLDAVTTGFTLGTHDSRACNPRGPRCTVLLDPCTFSYGNDRDGHSDVFMKRDREVSSDKN